MPPDNLSIHDITKAAGGYSQLAGIMAGFSFAVLVWVVERLNTRDENLLEDVIIIRALVYLGITFLGNLVDSFFWALLSGEQSPGSNRAAILSYVSSWQMAQLAPLTMQAMTLVVSTAGSPYAVKLFRRIFFVTMGIAAAFVWSHTVSIMASRHPAVGFDLRLWVILAVFVLLLVLGIWISSRPPTRRFRLDTEASFSNFVSVSLLGTLLAGVGFAVATAATTDMPLPWVLLGLANLAWAALVAWSCAFLPNK